MRKIFLLLFFSIYLYNNLYSQCGRCDTQDLVNLQQNNNIKKQDIIEFLHFFDGRCKNNPEFSEFSNELLYFLLSNNTANLILEVLSEEKSLPIEEIKESIENPISDDIDLCKTYKNIEKIKSYKKNKNIILKSIKIALDK